MELAKSGNIGKICVPNAMATFEEYLNDFASGETKEIGKRFIKSEIEKINGTAKRKTEQMIEKVDAGERDVYL
jgi:2-iminoacetate synthase